MFNNPKTIFSVIGGICLLLSGQAMAENLVAADKLASLVTDKTIRAKHLKKGFEFSVYFDKDGKTAFRKEGNTVTQTTYKIEGDKHCIFWKGKEQCAQIRDNGDGTYARVNKKGQPVVMWTKIEAGKKL